MAENKHIDAATRERNKTPEEKAADIAYTVNHSISCGTTDIFVQPVAAVMATTLAHESILPKWLHWITNLFEAKDVEEPAHPPKISMPEKFMPEGKDVKPGKFVAEDVNKAKWQRVRARLKEELQPKRLFSNVGSWATGEVAGDVGGVLPTILMQRWFPGFMQGIRNVVEPVAGGFYRSGAERDARHWGKKHGYAEGSAEVKAKEETLYQNEVSHLPQAVMWNVFSIPINFFTQLAVSKQTGNKFTISEFLIGKTFGSVFSNTVLLGGRGIAPELFNKWDEANSKHVIKPVMQSVGGLFGVDKDTIERAHRDAEANHSHGHSVQASEWQGRLQQRDVEAEQAPDSARLA